MAKKYIETNKKPLQADANTENQENYDKIYRCIVYLNKLDAKDVFQNKETYCSIEFNQNTINFGSALKVLANDCLLEYGKTRGGEVLESQGYTKSENHPKMKKHAYSPIWKSKIEFIENLEGWLQLFLAHLLNLNIIINNKLFHNVNAEKSIKIKHIGNHFNALIPNLTNNQTIEQTNMPPILRQNSSETTSKKTNLYDQDKITSL